MDKLNYTLKREEIQELKGRIREIKREVIKLIKESNIIKRKRVIKKYSTLVEGAILYIVEQLSFQRLADVMAVKYDVFISDTSWKKQISKAAPIFYEVMMKYLNSNTKELKSRDILGYSSAYAIDATDIALEGKKGTILRAHTEYDLSGIYNFNTLIADIHTGESVILHHIKPNSLYFADRAYGKTRQMGYIMANRADFVFRFSPSQVRLFKDCNCKEKMNFKAYLKEQEGTSSFECYFKHGKLVRKIRAIVAPLPEDKVEIAVTKAKRKSVKKQNKLSPDTITYAKWLFLATSLSDSISSEEIISAYSNRWQIELHFKRSKSLLRFHKVRRCSSHYAFCIVSIWLAVTAFVYSLFHALLLSLSFDISDFNAFSLFTSLIA